MDATHILLYVLLDLAIIIVAARGLGALARRMGQPGVIGEVIAGILLGPTVLGRLIPGAPDELFPKEVPLRQIADLGLVFFMFLVGLELDTRLVKKEGRRALTISLGGIILPFALGALIGFPLLALNNGGEFAPGVTAQPTQLTFSLFMGAAMCITAFPVLARILVERGLYKAPLGTSALCAAAVDDVTAWILLAAVVGLTRTGSMAEAGTVFLLSGVFTAFMIIVVRPALGILSRRYEARGHLTIDQVAIVVVLLLLAAYATELIGIHSIFGAFILGTIMPHGSGMTRELTDKIEDFTVVVLLPVFFTVAGLRTNLFSINSPELIAWMVLIIAAAIVGKMGGCGIAARLNGYSTRDSFALGTLMNTRGLTELVILSIGLSLGVLSDRTFAMMVIMALVTTFMAAPIMNRIMPRKEMVRVLAGGDPEPVACRMLVAIGNPDNAALLVDAAIRLTGNARPAELLLVRLVPTTRAPEFRTGLRDEESQVDRSLDAMNRLANRAATAGVAARGVSFLTDNVGGDLGTIAASQRCDGVLLGWHRAHLEKTVLRALVHRVFKEAPCDVMVFVDRKGEAMVPATGPVVAALTSGEDNEAVNRVASRAAAGLQTNLQPVDFSRSSTRSTTQLRKSRMSFAVPTVESLPVDTATQDQIVRETASATLVVVAVDRQLPDEIDFGQPAEALAAHAECPVIVLHPGTIPQPVSFRGTPRRVQAVPA